MTGPGDGPAPVVEVLADAGAVARRTAELIAAAVAGGGAMALSGGSTPVPMYGLLAGHREVDWSAVHVHQVDERLVADPADPDRNWRSIEAGLVEPTGAHGHPMPLDGGDYPLPARVSVIHLGLGGDGHTASLVPGDPVLAATHVGVAVTEPYQGHRRLTLTAGAINAAEQIVWQVVGAGKRDALRRLLDADPKIPGSLVRRSPRVIVVADQAAMSDGRG